MHAMNAMPEQPETLMTTQAVSEWLKITERTLWRWRADGEGPPWQRVGRFIRYRRSDVQNWIDSRR